MGRRVSAALSTGLLVATAACSSFAGGSSSEATSSSTPASQSSTASETTTSESTTSTSSSSSPGGPLDTDDAGRKLTLTDFFQPDTNWQEKRYDIADQEDVQGIGSELTSCGQSYARGLELRLANKFEELTFSAAQANDSRSSDQNLVVEVLANNEQVEIRSVPFNQVQDFSISVDGVNALKILLYLDDEVDTCSYNSSVVGVLTDATVN